MTGVEANIDETTGVVEGQRNTISLDFNVRYDRARSTNIRGLNLWKVSVWASSSSDGSGQTFSYAPQGLSNAQQNTPVTRDVPFRFSGVNFDLDLRELTCNQVPYICMKLEKGSRPSTQFDLNFRPDRTTTYQDCVMLTTCSGENYLLAISFMLKGLGSGGGRGENMSC